MDLVYDGYEHYEDDVYISDDEEPMFIDYVLDQFNLYIDILNTVQVDQRKLTAKEIFINAINSLRWSTTVFNQMITKNISQKDIIYLIKELSKKFCYKKGPYKILFSHHGTTELGKKEKEKLIEAEQYGYIPNKYEVERNKELIPNQKNISYNIHYVPRLRPSLYWKLIKHVKCEALKNNSTTVTTIATTKKKDSTKKIIKNELKDLFEDVDSDIDEDVEEEEEEEVNIKKIINKKVSPYYSGIYNQYIRKSLYDLMKINKTVLDIYEKIVDHYFNEKVISFEDFFSCEDILNKVQDKAEIFCQFKAFLSDAIFWDNLKRFTTKENLVKLINKISMVRVIFAKMSTEKEFKNIIDLFTSDELFMLNTHETFSIGYSSKDNIDPKIIKKILLIMDKLSGNMTKKEYALYKQRYFYGQFGEIIKEHEQFEYRKFGQPNDIGVFEYEI